MNQLLNILKENYNVWEANNCFVNVFKIKKVLKENGINSTIKYGSLSFGKEARKWVEFGFDTEKEMVKEIINNNNSWDLHSWLELDNGIVIDMFFKNYKMISDIRGVSMDMDSQTYLIGNYNLLSKDSGFHLIPIKNKKYIKTIQRKTIPFILERIKMEKKIKEFSKFGTVMYM
jgi:hypothetical protein